MYNNFLKPSDNGRAWVEIDMTALVHNIAVLRSSLPVGCELMAVVKTDAYGHGAVKVALRAQQEGVKSFAVATVGEGVQLRECGVDGDILVLGYTHPSDTNFLSAFWLTQLVFDSAYAKALDEAGHIIRVHIAVDTGMHRLGVESSNLEEFEEIYACENLKIEGVATHFASADSLEVDDMDFTSLQMTRFSETISMLKRKGYTIGKLHAQSSYGIINYPVIAYDSARAGIMLYGVMSHNESTLRTLNLRPMLAFRALVAQVRRIRAGESVSYGRAFTAEKPMLLATICAGYGDGVPRQMSGNGGCCIVRGHKVPIVGRICMDMLMVDVTGIDDVRQGDIVTILGKDGSEEIRCEDVAAASGTISNDILCRIGWRLPKVYIG